MNYSKVLLKGIVLFGICTLPSSVITATEMPETDIVTIDISESTEAVVSNMTLSAPSEPKTTGVDMRNVGLHSTGFDISEMVAKPRPVILDSNAVPDGEGVCNSANFTYMAYTAVTSRNSGQYKLLYGDSAYTDTVTGLRMVDGRYCIAVGTFYASKIGTKINLVMANGGVVECILGDVKSDEHTDPTHRYQKYDGSVAEMIVDYQYFKSTAQYPSVLQGRISRIEIVE